MQNNCEQVQKHVRQEGFTKKAHWGRPKGDKTKKERPQCGRYTRKDILSFSEEGRTEAE